MNILFLDIDGVVLTHRAERYFEQVNYGYNPRIFHNFLRIIEEASIPTRIVLNSTTKKDTKGHSCWWWIRSSGLRKRFRELLHPNWNDIPWKFITGNREDGIVYWMEQYASSGDVPIALDDSPSAYQNADSLGIHFIRCYAEAGITTHQLTQLELALGGTFTKIASAREWDKKYGRG